MSRFNPDKVIKGEDGKLYKIVACAIENDGVGGWRQIAGNHNSINVSSVVADASKIRVSYGFTAKKVCSFVACPDEMFSQNGYNFGASVGLSYADITVGREYSLGGYMYYNGSAWVYSGVGAASGVFSSGTLTITHNSIGGLLASCSCRGGAYLTSIGALGATTTEILFKDYAGATVTTADTNMKVYFKRSVSPSTPVDPTTLNLSGANIWCYGIMEI